MRSSALLLSAVLLTACGEDDPPEVPVSIPTLLGIDPFTQLQAPVGQPLTIEVRLVGPSGEPAQDYVFEWLHPENEPGQHLFEESSPSPGTERLTVTGAYARDITVFARLHGGTERSPEMWQSPYVHIRFYGGEPVDLVAFHRRLKMRVGEVRATGALPMALTDRNRHLSDDPVTCATADAAVATVDERCVVTARSEGETTLVLGHGPQQRSVPVQVTGGPLGPPPVPLTINVTGADDDELHQTLEGQVGFRGALVHDHALVEDSRGYPHFVTRAWPLSTSGTLAVLASWTGSGFGLEEVSRRWESAADPQLTIDARGRLYVVYRDERSNHLVLAERELSGGPGSWRHRLLDQPLAEARTLQISSLEVHQGNDTQVAALAPRPGGGVWIAFLDVVDAWRRGELEVAVGAECVRRLLMLEVTDEAIAPQEVARTLHSVVSTTPRRCHHELSPPHTARLLMLPGAAAGTAPRLLSLHPMGDDGLVRYEPQAGGWTREVVVAPRQLDTGFVERPVYMTLSRPVPVDGDPQLFALMQAESSFGTVVVAPGLPQARFGAAFDWDPSVSDLRLFAFGSADQRWVGGSHLRKLARLSPFGGMHFDDLLQPEQVSAGHSVDWGKEELWGLHTDGQTLSTVTSGPIFRRRPVPGPVPKPTDTPEGRGQRLSAQRRTPYVFSPPVVRADGSSAVVSTAVPLAEDDFDPDPATREPVFGQVLRSSGVGAPFEQSVLLADDYLSLGLRRLWELPGALVGLNRNGGNFDLRWHRSTDEGLSWMQWGSVPTTASPLAELVTPEGAAFVCVPAGQGYELWFSAALHDTPEFTKVADFSALTSTHGFVTGPEWTGLLRDGDDALLLTTLRDNATSGWQLHLRRFSLSSGAEGAQVFAQVPGSNGRPDLAAVTAAGAVLVPAFSGALGGADVFWRVDPVTGEVVEGGIPGTRLTGVRLAKLTDGRMAAVFTSRDSLGRMRARLAISADGFSWSGPVVLRADGGAGQFIGAVAAEPGGGLLIALGDNGAFTSTLDTESLAAPQPPRLLLGLPPLDFSLLRVAAP